ncbi:HTH domain-containing protein [Streptomyces venezuelae]|uniref:HTH domain-containing protein n=1 Tax=Streptomyces venezuelae TaxID=54571 RepID=UPI00136B099F|nr:hypothetical protein [Streptomyces sp. SID335]MYZ18106.1 hypothetical protein [Streptomyces sp. SID337]NDZ86544.1 helix-turn-helix transcriptional regulator [Streptomyces sp. SID10115]NEA00526.1 helix-turn-helix transcriptional regulator [Streptomyces sp. SID10116]NEB45457.1 helix-turn-helix transcriptional regulator [Streptomyces sp. SID339]
MKFLRTREKGSTKPLAARLGVSRRTVQRYLSGASIKPNKRLQAVLVQETESEGQPQISAQAGQRAASSGGLVISCRGYFGLGPEGNLGCWLGTGHHGRRQSLPCGRHHRCAGGWCDGERSARRGRGGHRDAYFRRGGGGRAGLEVQFADVEWLNSRFISA